MEIEKPEENTARRNNLYFQALSTDLIVRNIFKFLTTKELLSARQVNHQWNQAAVSILRRRPTFLVLPPQLSDHEYDKLGQAIEGSAGKWNFPATGLYFPFDSFWDLISATRNMVNAAAHIRLAPRDFLARHGQMFTALRLQNYNKPMLLNLAMFRMMPNLEFLHTDLDPIIAAITCLWPDDDEAVAEQRRLMRLRFGRGVAARPSTLVLRLLKTAPSIRKIEGFVSCNIQEYETLFRGKSHLIKFLDLHCFLESWGDVCETLMENPERLTTLDLFKNRNAIWSENDLGRSRYYLMLLRISALLNASASKETLKTLSIEQESQLLRQPEMQKVAKFMIQIHEIRRENSGEPLQAAAVKAKCIRILYDRNIKLSYIN